MLANEILFVFDSEVAIILWRPTFRDEYEAVSPKKVLVFRKIIFYYLFGTPQHPYGKSSHILENETIQISTPWRIFCCTKQDLEKNTEGIKPEKSGTRWEIQGSEMCSPTTLYPIYL